MARRKSSPGRSGKRAGKARTRSPASGAKSRLRSARSRGSRRSAAAHAATKDVRARVRDFTLRAVRSGDLRLRELPSFARTVLGDAAAGLNRAVPESSRNVLRQVVDGLADATAATASTAKSALSSSAERGSKILRVDARRAIRDLRSLEGDFIRAMERAGKSFKGAAREEMQSIVDHAKRAGTRIRPAVQRASKAIDGRVLELGTESAKAGARAGRSALETALRGAGGLFDALGEAVSRAPSRKTPR